MRYYNEGRSTLVACLLIISLLAAPAMAFAKKGEKNYKRGRAHEAAQQWEQAAQEYALAVAADPSSIEYQLHYHRARFQASQSYMKKGRELAEREDYAGAYNAFRQAYGYDPVNELALSEMDRMLRLQREKDGLEPESKPGDAPGARVSPTSYQTGAGEAPPTRTSRQRVITIAPGQDLKTWIRKLAEEIGLTVVFDPQSFQRQRTTELDARNITAAEALDLLFLQEGLFFQKVGRNIILVADQNRRNQYQQLGVKTFYLKNADPETVKTQIQTFIPPQPGRPQVTILSNKTTNSLTIRDTPENLRVLSQIIESIDKDRAEVVMDVRIYEITHTDLLQFGNQVGTTLGQTSGLSVLSGSRQVVNQIKDLATPTAMGAAFLIPASTLTALQSKDRAKLVFQTQLHAFDNEESSADIGQKVPIQTAQVPNYYPVGNQNNPGGGNTGVNPGVFGNYNGGYPVIQYTDVGLKLKFKPQVFPNRDVQVRMDITSSSLASAGDANQNLTPSFNQRVITGTARIPNNRTMMVANIAQNQEIRGQKGLPLVSLIPGLNRLFTAPTRNNVQSDIVLVVTPHVLRSPDITPSDQDVRPSGTMQSPTTESLAELVEREERNEQLAAARRSPAAHTETAARAPREDELPTYLPAPKILINDGRTTTPTGFFSLNGATTTEAVASGSTPALRPVAFSKSLTGGAGAQLGFLNAASEMKRGEKQLLALALQADVPLALAIFKLRFDPRVISVRTVKEGSIFDGSAAAPRLTQSVDPAGRVLISASAAPGATLGGEGALIFLEIEALADGASQLSFEEGAVRLIDAEGREVPVRFAESRVSVK